jgi:hypothetical protein
MVSGLKPLSRWADVNENQSILAASSLSSRVRAFLENVLRRVGENKSAVVIAEMGTSSNPAPLLMREAVLDEPNPERDDCTRDSAGESLNQGLVDGCRFGRAPGASDEGADEGL